MSKPTKAAEPSITRDLTPRGRIARTAAAPYGPTTRTAEPFTP